MWEACEKKQHTIFIVFKDVGEIIKINNSIEWLKI